MRDADREEALSKRHRRIGEFVDALPDWEAWERPRTTGLVSLKVRFPTEEDPSALLVVRSTTEEGGLICFVGAYSLGDALLALRAKLLKGSAKWREDVPWSER